MDKMNIGMFVNICIYPEDIVTYRRRELGDLSMMSEESPLINTWVREPKNLLKVGRRLSAQDLNLTVQLMERG